MSRSASPPRTISSPVSMKSGIAINGNALMECSMRCGSMFRSIPLNGSTASALNPSANASGMPSSAVARNVTRMIVLIRPPPKLCPSRR